MAELPRQSCGGLRFGVLRGWRRSERRVLLACVMFAVFEVLVIVALARVVEGAMS